MRCQGRAHHGRSQWPIRGQGLVHACHLHAYTHPSRSLRTALGPQALTALGCMEHRGACSADDDSGDGAGLMVQIPWKLIKKEFPNVNEATTG
jgi:glutamate synthase domain-containing protein 1